MLFKFLEGCFVLLLELETFLWQYLGHPMSVTDDGAGCVLLLLQPLLSSSSSTEKLRLDSTASFLTFDHVSETAQVNCLGSHESPLRSGFYYTLRIMKSALLQLESYSDGMYGFYKSYWKRFLYRVSPRAPPSPPPKKKKTNNKLDLFGQAQNAEQKRNLHNSIHVDSSMFPRVLQLFVLVSMEKNWLAEF